MILWVFFFFFSPFFSVKFQPRTVPGCCSLRPVGTRGFTNITHSRLLVPNSCTRKISPGKYCPRMGLRLYKQSPVPVTASEPSVRSGAQLGNLRSAVRVLLFARLVRSYI